jgi:hypothetical protein
MTNKEKNRVSNLNEAMTIAAIYTLQRDIGNDWTASEGDFREYERRVSKVTFLQVHNRTGRPWHDDIYKMQIWKDGRQIPSTHTILENLAIHLDEIKCAMGTSDRVRHSRNKGSKNLWEENLNWHIESVPVSDEEAKSGHESKIVVGPMTSTQQHSQFTQCIKVQNPYIC